MLCGSENACSKPAENGKLASCAEVGGPLFVDGKLRSPARPGEAADPERLRDPSRADASEDEPMTNEGTMPLRAGEDTCDGLVDVVVVLGEDSI